MQICNIGTLLAANAFIHTHFLNVLKYQIALASYQVDIYHPVSIIYHQQSLRYLQEVTRFQTIFELFRNFLQLRKSWFIILFIGFTFLSTANEVAGR